MYTTRTLLQVGMIMLAIIIINHVLILNGEWLITNHVQGPIYDHHAMRMSRAQFKFALRQCRLEKRSITSTHLAYPHAKTRVSRFLEGN